MRSNGIGDVVPAGLPIVHAASAQIIETFADLGGIPRAARTIPRSR